MSKSRSNCRRDGPRGQVTADGGRPALDRVLEGLSRERDRHILYHLMDNEPTEFDELVDAIAAVEAGRSAAAVPDDVHEEIRTKLYHMRLPKLEDLGIIEFDERSGAVRYRNPPPHFEEFLHLARDLDER